MTQLTLFGDAGVARPPANWTDTSQSAAASMRSEAQRQEDRVLAAIEARGERGATNEELAVELGLRLSSVCARSNALWEKHAIRDSSERRMGSSGRPAKVWVRA